jgi:predicted flap endonuclease-1-like 5' DNA nuclease
VPRNLGDVADYFLPRAGGAPPARRARASDGPSRPVLDRPAALPIVALPVGERDVVRAAFAWNLAVEVSRLGACASLLAPTDPEAAPLWPESGPGPLGTEVVMTQASDLPALGRAALDLAVSRAAESEAGGLVLVRVPPAWLADGSDARALLRWVLLFSADEPREMLETYALAKAVLASHKAARIPERQEIRGKKAEAFKGFTKPKGEPDNLKLIPGIGQELEHKLTKLGLIKFEQIANLTDDEIAKLDDALKLNGAIENNDWVAKSVELMAETTADEVPAEDEDADGETAEGEAEAKAPKAKDAKPAKAKDAKKPKKG